MSYSTVGTASLITQVMREVLDIDDPTENDNVEWRDRSLAVARRVVKKVWEYPDAHPWDFVTAIDSVSLPAASGTGETDSVVTAPARFRRVGPLGSVAIPAQRLPLRYIDPQEMFARRRVNKEQGAYPRYYTVYGLDTASGLPKLFFYPFSQNTVTVQLSFETTPPALTDEDPGGLQYLPPEWYETILVVGMADILAAANGDGRSEGQWSPRFVEALNDAYTSRLHGIESPRGVGRQGVGLWRQH